MTVYIENLLLCLLIPMLLAAAFLKGAQRRLCLFVITGMAACLAAAYVSSFFMGVYEASALTAALEISPLCEETVKLLPLLFYIAVFEPDRKEVIPAAIGIAVGFATFENCCYIIENGTEDFTFLLIRGISAGAMHILCGILTGFGLELVWRRRWLAAAGTVGVLCLAISLHGIYNLLISAGGVLQGLGYVLPSVGIAAAWLMRLTLRAKRKTE